MKMEHEEYVELRDQLEVDFTGVFRRIDDCTDIVTKEESKIQELKDSMAELKVEQAKTNTRLGVLIAILSAIGVPIVGVCIKLLFGG